MPAAISKTEARRNAALIRFFPEKRFSFKALLQITVQPFLSILEFSAVHQLSHDPAFPVNKERRRHILESEYQIIITVTGGDIGKFGSSIIKDLMGCIHIVVKAVINIAYQTYQVHIIRKVFVKLGIIPQFRYAGTAVSTPDMDYGEIVILKDFIGDHLIIKGGGPEFKGLSAQLGFGDIYLYCVFPVFLTGFPVRSGLFLTILNSLLLSFSLIILNSLLFSLCYGSL